MQYDSSSLHLHPLALALAVLLLVSQSDLTQPASAQTCQPRPPVKLTTSTAGDGHLLVIVTAGVGTIQALRFEQLVNARIDIGGLIGQTAPFIHTPPAGTAQVSFMLHRQGPGSATVQRLVVVDGCGDWRTFVGAGTGAWPPPTTINWSQGNLTKQLLVGTSALEVLSVTASQALQGADLVVSSELQPFLSSIATQFDAPAGQGIVLPLPFSVPLSTTPLTVSGTIAIRHKGVILSPGLPISLTIVQPSSTTVGEGFTQPSSDLIITPSNEAPYVSGELVIRFQNSTSTQRISQIIAGIGGTIVGKDTPNLVFQVRVTQDPNAVLTNLSALSEVLYATRRGLYAVAQTPPDWGTPSVAPSVYLPLQTIQLPAAWDLTTGSPSSIVGIVDVGVDRRTATFGHTDLEPAIPVTWSQQVSPQGYHQEHGVWVSGVLGARANTGEGMTGVLWNRTLLVLGAGIADISQGRVYIDPLQAVKQMRVAISSGARVINYSVGGLAPSIAVAFAMTRDMGVLVEEQQAAGDRALFVISAGNDHKDALLDTPAMLSSEANVLTVGGTTADGASLWVEGPNHGSNYGGRVSVAAPAKDIYTTTPYTCTTVGACSPQRHQYVSGTSFAAPLASGVAALVFDYAEQRSIPVTASQVKHCIVNGSTDAGRFVTGPDNVAIPVLNARRALDFLTPPVRGTLTNSSTGQPVAGASVTMDLSSGQAVSTTTNNFGIYDIQGVRPGNHTLNISSFGYLVDSRAISVAPCTPTVTNISLSANPWMSLPTGGAPSPRAGHIAVWTGSEMIIWDSNECCIAPSGAKFNPALSTWSPLPAPAGISGGVYHAPIWTGSEMIIWGGYNGNSSSVPEGARYSPSTNTWTSLPTTGAPTPVSGHTAVWSGSEMIIWGGAGFSNFNSEGGRYNPATNAWTLLSTTSAPSPRFGHTAVWTGSEMIVWGGRGPNPNVSDFGDGARFNPATNAWTPMSSSGAPTARNGHTAIWTGSEMLIWGGVTTLGNAYQHDGARYNPATNAWSPLITAGQPSPRYGHTAVWTGSEMVVWGGLNFASGALGDGGRFNPSTNTWTLIPTTGSPLAPRLLHTAIWTGNQMLIWGGYNGESQNYQAFNDGARYTPP